MQEQQLFAGAAQVEITPPLGTLINGDFITHYATRIHDRMWVKALVLKNKDITVAIVVVDICAMQKDFLDGVRTDIYERTAIPPSHILIAATHTHAAGSVAPLLMGAADMPYRKNLPKLIVDAVQQANDNVRSAALTFGSVLAPEHLLCRRYRMQDSYLPKNPVTGCTDEIKTNPFGAADQIISSVSPVDTELSFMAVKGLDGKWISVLANYSLHYVGDWPDGTISPDYFGEFAKALRSGLQADDDFVGIMSNGTSGDVNCWDFVNPGRYPSGYHEKSRVIGYDLADKVSAALQNVAWYSHPALAVQYKEISLQVRKPSSAELEKAKAIVAATTYENIQKMDEAALEKIYAREQVLLQEFPDEVLFPLQAIKAGDILIGGVGGECFSETGRWLKRHFSPGKYFTITMANDYTGYIPPAHEIEKGGYETWRCRTSYFSEAAEKRVRESLLQLLRLLPPSTT